MLRHPLAAFVLAFSPAVLCAQTLPPGFTYQLITDNQLVQACAMAFAPDGRLFVCERTTGNIRVVQDGFLLNGNWATVPCALNNGGDHGLLGIAIDPGFLTNRYVYVYYTTTDQLQNRIARFEDVGGVGVNFTILSPNGAIPTGSIPNHNGGRMVFGRDGTLFVGTSDRTDITTPQSMNSWNGKVLRFTVPNLGIPANNPVAGSPIYSRGHRSQYGLAIRPSNGDLFNTEVGNLAMDEINRIVSNGNYGWPIHEGTEITPDPQTVDPIAVFNPTPEPTGCCFYSGTLYPAGYAGAFFFVEYSEGRVRKLDLNAAGTAVLSQTIFDDLGQALDIQMGPDGHLWVLHNDTLGQRGADEIGRYVYTGEPVPGVQAMAVSNRTIGGSLTFGVRANLGDIVVAWLSLSALPASVPTPFGPMWVTPDLPLSAAVALADEAYITLPIANNPSFAGYSIFVQAASVSPLGVILTSANFDSVALTN
jgi:glucose/arabinose dehydrogenase